MLPFSPSTLGWREAAAAARAVRSGEGQTASFENESARFLGLRGAAAFGNAETAFALALRALGAGPGKEVVLPACALPAWFRAVRFSGASAVPADVLWHDANISVAQVRRRMTHRTAAVVAVHSFGAAAEIESLLKLGIPLVEDLSQAFGARDYDRRLLGTFGRAAVASLGGGDLFTSGGEGGLILSDDRRVLDAARAAAADFPAAPMTPLQAAVGRVQLGRLPAFISARRRAADRCRAALRGSSAIETPLQIYGRVYHSFVLRCRRPVTDALLRRFTAEGVDARRPIHRLSHWGTPGSAFPVAERLWRRSLALPLHPLLTEAALDRIAATAVRLIQ